ncbi:MAG: POTRA domain-containing protein [Pyrinomonadaceae bacterium]
MKRIAEKYQCAELGRRFARAFSCVITAIVFSAIFASAAHAQNKFEKRRIAKTNIVIAGAEATAPLIEEYRIIIREALGTTYSTPRVRDAIEALYNTRRIDTVTVAAAQDADGDVELTFSITRKTQAERLSVVVGPSTGDRVTEQELLFKLNLLTPGTVITEQTLQNNADEILDYLRERGFYKSTVTYERQRLSSESEVGVTFRVNPSDQTTVSSFAIRIDGYTKPIDPKSLKLKPGGVYSRDRLQADIARVRSLLKAEDFLAPTLNEEQVVYDTDTNTIAVTLTGKVGPKVKVTVETEQETVSERTQNSLLPVKRDGTLDFAAIVEGGRRLENYYQERGYFFNSVAPVCSAIPQIVDTENAPIGNDSQFLCGFLSGEDLMGREVEVKYKVNLGRRLRLTEIRIAGTNRLPIEEVKPALDTQEANLLGIVPLLGYGRGYTSAAILEEDQATIKGLMAELGFRDATVAVNRGVSPTGDDLIITFQVEENLPYLIDEIAFSGNTAVPTADLLAQIPTLSGQFYSRAKERNAVRRIREYYSNLGYYDARVSSVMTDSLARGGQSKDVRLEFKIGTEGKKVLINRLFIDGVQKTKPSAVRHAVTLKEGELLRAADIYSSEQSLYGTDAFDRVEIKPRPAGEAPTGERLSDVLVSVSEQPARLISYGGGFSTDLGLSGFFDIRHVNLFGNLWQGGARVKMSQRQQLVQFDFINPRFIRDGNKRFAPLTLSLQYQRDSTVTRFFRSTFDQGTFGIVQRIDSNGNAIDEFGAETGSPTINRLAFTAETSRTISRKNRSILFLRYRFEDVRLFKIESLLIKELLRPDQRTRISGFGATFVRDTRRNCSRRDTLLELIARGETSPECRYNASDPTDGQYVTADYNVSLPFLGANRGFQKFQGTYNFFYSFPRIKYTTIAARAIVGVGHVFSGGDRFTSTQFPSLNGLLPISERFFGGGSNNIRGFDFEQAGPRVVVVPQGQFRNRQGEPVFLDPFTIPFGGNALAVINIEARVPFSGNIRVVPFYDGGNVFRKATDVFRRPVLPPNDVAEQNQRAAFTHTLGLGLRIKTPVGGEFAVDYGRLLNPPSFLIPQSAGGNAIYRLPSGQLHFRFSQAF